MKIVPGDPQTFDLQSCRDLLSKLERDIDRLRRAATREDAADFAFDCAVTGFHLADWVARDIMAVRAEPRNQTTPPDYTVTLPVSGATKKEMTNNLQNYARSHCPEYDICQTFANAGKHGDRNYKGADVVAVFVGHNIEGPFYASDGTLLIPETRGPDAKYSVGIFIRPMGSVYDAVQLFERIYTFWHGLIYKHQIG